MGGERLAAFEDVVVVAINYRFLLSYRFGRVVEYHYYRKHSTCMQISYIWWLSRCRKRRNNKETEKDTKLEKENGDLPPPPPYA